MATKSTAASAEKKTAAKRPVKKAAKPTKYLLIVESPAKAKTIKKYLGYKYEVMSSRGHIRDLPASRLGVDVEHDFTPEYIVPRKDGKSALLKELQTAAQNSKGVYLATDPDREGEAIAWHLAELLKLDEDAPIRVTFNEITKRAVNEGMAAPRTIDKNLVSAQQTRRILDRIVGYKLSPFLWHKVKRGLSAGRVQSVATRLVVDKEKEIEAFVPQEYWNIDAWFKNGRRKYSARMAGTTRGKLTVSDKQTADKILEKLKGAEYTVTAIKRQEKQKNPHPPFTTSSLQQEASVHLNMHPQRTMSVAQSLYEGVDVAGRGPVGLITYMRTDSLRISQEAQAAAKEYITAAYGGEYYPKTPRVFKTRRSAQDAHEAIRPTDVNLLPEQIRGSLTGDQYRLYRLIWERFTASQMASARYDVQSVEITAAGYVFRAADTKMRFDGFTKLYRYADDEEKSALPALEEGQVLAFETLTAEQKFTQPPARYTEASLIRTLEENGIGRPSTYAPIIGTIIERNYVEREGKTLRPTALGNVTTELMIDSFRNIVDVGFTADMETRLDKVEDGTATSLEILKDFYSDFEKSLQKAEETTERRKVELPVEESDVVCEFCGRKMVYKISRYGRFLACPGYPECKNTKPVYTEAQGKCPKCGKQLVIKRTRTGKIYYACADGVDCKFMTWDTPQSQTCPKCGSTLFRRFGKLSCLKEGCGYECDAPKRTKNKKEE